MAVITRRVTIPPKRTSVIFDVPTPSGDVTVSGNPEAVQKALPSIRRGHGGGGGVTVTPQDTTASTAQAEAARQAQAQQQADAQRIQQQVAQRQLVQQYVGSRQTSAPSMAIPINVQIGDYYEKKQVGSFMDVKGRTIPEYKTTIQESPETRRAKEVETKYKDLIAEEEGERVFVGTSEQYGQYLFDINSITRAEGAWTERELTREEEKYVMDLSPGGVLGLESTKRITPITKLKWKAQDIYGGTKVSYLKAEESVSKSITTPAFEKLKLKEITEMGVETGLIGVSRLIPESTYKQSFQEFEKGLYVGQLEDIRRYPLKTGVILGATAGIGFGISGGVAGVRAGTTIIAGSKAGAIVGKGLQAGIIGTGIFYGGQSALAKGTEVYSAFKLKEYRMAGEISGVAFKDTAIALYGFKVGGKAFAKVDPFTKVTRIEVIRKSPDPSAVEVGYRNIIGGKEIRLAQYKITGERRPPLLKIETTAFRDLFKLPPKKTIPIPPKMYSVDTIYPAIYGKPFWVSEITKGSRVGKVKQITGTSMEINIRTGKLTQLDKYLLQQYASDISGRPVSMKNVQKFFAKESDFTRSYIGSERMFDVKISGKKPIKVNILSPKETGRLTTYDLGITRTKPLLETDYMRVFASKTYFKDISKPFARASGKTPKLRTILYEIKEPIFSDDVSSVEFIKKADIVKTSWSKTFQEQAAILSKEQLFKALPKMSRIPTPPKVDIITIPKTSAFAGLGLYERTDIGMGLAPASFTGMRGRTITPVSFKEISITKQFPGLVEIQKTKQFPGLKEKPALKEETILKLLPELKTIEKVKQTQKLKQIQKLKQLEKFKSFSISGTYKPPYKKPPITLFPFMKGLKLPKQTFGKYSVFGRRFGKFKLVGISGTEKGAFGLGKKFARETLGVTFKIPGVSGRKLPGYKTKFTKEGALYIEPRGRRLKRGTQEIPEILYYKKLRSRR